MTKCATTKAHDRVCDEKKKRIDDQAGDEGCREHYAGPSFNNHSDISTHFYESRHQFGQSMIACLFGCADASMLSRQRKSLCVCIFVFLSLSLNLLVHSSVAGWHCSYFGGLDSVRRKLGAYAHTEMDRPDITDKEHVKVCGFLSMQVGE